MKNSKGVSTATLLLILGFAVIIFGVIFYLINPYKIVSGQFDAQKKKDLAQMQKTLEAYYADFKKYPEYDTNNYTVKLRGVSVPWGNPFLPYSMLLPKDPDPRYRYVYYSDPENNNQTYRLYAVLENTNDPSACNANGVDCPNVPGPKLCGSDAACNFGVSSRNTSP